MKTIEDPLKIYLQLKKTSSEKRIREIVEKLIEKNPEFLIIAFIAYEKVRKFFPKEILSRLKETTSSITKFSKTGVRKYFR